ncbi:MAG TPA: ATP-binding protein [Chitinophagaceae bacterium]|nr:ATP-binding protein [Chitinophagaceae bacterium]
MKAIDEMHICPYTGLRSFTEEESLYFKGRDLQIDQITALLEQNKFLMVTGASGEGKSSLIYGGLIPNARAGFFKSKHTNWVIADFRPERSPVTNMANALAGHFNTSPSTLETELRRGYSSLVDLYTSSSFYSSEEDEDWSRLLDEEKKDRRRRSANLMIIIDQFEEFFTNPENFYKEAPSNDSQIVVNLVLETARIAIRRNLPVYVVCTMRSDYIGQCSAFRGLPEYIGFSQFFVPRLKRKDLKQVIEEPAILSGNSISQRLVERLVYDISDGVDQLPILQHALSRIWEAADHGNEEMDLLHYAKVGGMPEVDLPDEDIPKFRKWISGLPEHERKFYQDTGLNKIIEIHANLLYENAWESYNASHPQQPITQQDAKRIIALAFSCLTKIDNSRAVRNRMTLEEITRIINEPRLTEDVVGEVLNIYREEGNSFIRPFKTGDPLTKKLRPETVLDITHESLIRNWNKLNQWANKEFEFYSAFLDFQKQLNRWKKSGKGKGYLLPIGPLTYFENWYNSCKPNAGWIKRYAETKEDQQESLRDAENVLADTREFLKRSARKEMITRAFMKYGPQRIATVLAILIMLGLTGFYWYDAEQKKNESVVKQIRTESMGLLSKQEVTPQQKAIYLLVEERNVPGSLIGNLQTLDFKNRLTIGVESYKQLLFIDKNREDSLKDDLIKLLTKYILEPEASATTELLLTEGNKMVILLAMDEYYNPNPGKKKNLVTLTGHNYDLVMRFLKDKKLYRPVIPTQMNVAIQNWLAVGSPSQDKIRSLLNELSPYANNNAEPTFDLYYAKGSFETNGRMPNNFNGGYHTLASLHAAIGDTAGIRWCFSKILENNMRDYFELARVLNNHINILGYLYQYGHRDKVAGVLEWVSSNTRDNPPQTLLRNAMIRAGYISHLYLLNVDPNSQRSTRGYVYPNLYFADRTTFDAIVEDYESTLKQIKDPQERNFQLAMQHKRKAMFYHKYWYDRKMPVDGQRLDTWLDYAVDLFKRTDSVYLEGKIESTLIYFGDGVRSSKVKKRDLFIYPDYRDGWFAWTYHSDYFFKYILRKNLVNDLYKTASDLESIHFWLAKAYEWKVFIPSETYSNPYPLSDSTLKAVIDLVDKHPAGMNFDRNMLRLTLANNAFDRNDSSEGMGHYRKLDLEHIIRSSNKYEYLEKTFILNMMNYLAVHLARRGHDAEAIKLVGLFETDRKKAINFLLISEKLFRENVDPRAFVFLDSAYSVSKKIDYADFVPDVEPRHLQIQVLSEIGSRSINNEAIEILRNLPENLKYDGIFAQVTGLAYEGNYYRALTAIPGTLTEGQDLDCRSAILLEAARAKEKQAGNKKWNAMDRYIDWYQIYQNYMPN